MTNRMRPAPEQPTGTKERRRLGVMIVTIGTERDEELEGFLRTIAALLVAKTDGREQ